MTEFEIQLIELAKWAVKLIGGGALALFAAVCTWLLYFTKVGFKSAGRGLAREVIKTDITPDINKLKKDDVDLRGELLKSEEAIELQFETTEKKILLLNGELREAAIKFDNDLREQQLHHDYTKKQVDSLESKFTTIIEKIEHIDKNVAVLVSQKKSKKSESEQIKP